MIKPFSMLAILLGLLLFVVAPAAAVEGESEDEPNDAMEQATSIAGYVIHGSVDEDDADDWFVLEGQEGTNPSFVLYFNDIEVEVDFEVYSDENYVALSGSYGSPDGLVCHVPGICYVHVYRWDNAGDYTIIINDGGPGGEQEPNDTMDQADRAAGRVLQGSIGGEDPEDWYVLEGQQSVEPVFVFSFDEEALEIDWEVYSGERVVLASDRSGSPEEAACTVPGACYIRVQLKEGEGDYGIKVNPGECAGEGELEPNDTQWFANRVDGLEIRGYMCEDEEDWYVLEGQEGSRPTFTIYFNDEEVEIDFTVYSDDEEVETAAGYGMGESLRCSVPGTCYIRAYHYSGEGEYRIVIEP